MKRLCLYSSCWIFETRACVVRNMPWAAAVLLFLCCELTYGYEMPKNLEHGLDGNIQAGVLATFGQTDSSAISVRTTLTYRSNRWENELDAKLYRNSSEVLVSRRNADGEILVDENGDDISDLVKSTTNDRRYISAQARWFVSSQHYVFGIADIDMDMPAGLQESSRQIGGVGYKLYRSKSDLISAAVGIGRKRLVETSDASEKGTIGYIGFRFVRKIGEKLILKFDLDSDFGSENRFSEAEASIRWKLRDPVSMKLKYNTRFNSTVLDPLNTFNDELEAALSVNLVVDVF